MPKKKSKTLAPCAYCGKVRPVTSEHFVPKGLWPTPRPNDLQTIPVCEKCNGGKSQDDNFLRDILAMNVFADGHPAACKLQAGEMARSMKRHQSAITREMLATGTPISIKKYRHLVPIEGVAIKFDGLRFSRAIFKMVRGLYFKIEGFRLPESVPYRVRRIRQPYIGSYWSEFSKNPVNGPFVMGDVFRCWYIRGDDQTESLWLLAFYDAVFITAATGVLLSQSAAAGEPNEDEIRPLDQPHAIGRAGKATNISASKHSRKHCG